MVFQPGPDPNRAPGGKRKGAGRPTKAAAAVKQTARELYLAEIEKQAKEQAEAYFKFAKDDPATARHLADKILPPVQKLEHSGNVIFNSNVPEDED